MEPKKNLVIGLACAVGAQLCWGFFPLYVALLESVDAVDFVAHRALWSFVILASGLFLSKFIVNSLLPSIKDTKESVADGETCGSLALAAILIVINWLTFVWAVNHDHKVDASLGYYICPHVVVLLGVCFLRERLSAIQWIAIALAGVGVGMMIMSEASFPMISIAIALSFGIYALVKKKVSASPLTGLLIETSFMLIPVLIYLYIRWPDEWLPLLSPWWLNVLMVGSGLATIIPLALYATAVKHIQLTTMGLLQYIGPTIQFFIGVYLYNETFDDFRIMGFGFVWAGVLLFMIALAGIKIKQRRNGVGQSEDVQSDDGGDGQSETDESDAETPRAGEV